MTRVAFFGHRSGATRAARAMGLDVREVELPARPDAARFPDGGLPEAIVALTEKAVVPAARARDALGVPGMGVATALRCSDKAMMKDAARRHGIPCADFEALMPGAPLDGVATRLGLPLVLKRREGSGGRGQYLLRALDLAPWVPPNYIAERFVKGAEISIDSIVAEGRPLFANPTEYFVPGFANIVPAALDPVALRAALDLNERMIAAMAIERGFTHCELYLTAEGPVFGEIAARPPGGHIMRLLRYAYAFDPWEAHLRVELGETPALPRAAKRWAGAWVLHPGQGRVREVGGVEEARAVPGVRGVQVRVQPGELVRPREGLGQDIGWIEAVGGTRDEVVQALRSAHARLRIDVET